MSTGERAHVRASALCNRASSMRLNQSSREGARRGMFHRSIETLSTEKHATLLQRRRRKRKPQGFPEERSKRKRERPRERAEAKVLSSRESRGESADAPLRPQALDRPRQPVLTGRVLKLALGELGTGGDDGDGGGTADGLGDGREGGKPRRRRGFLDDGGSCEGRRERGNDDGAPSRRQEGQRQ